MYINLISSFVERLLWLTMETIPSSVRGLEWQNKYSILVSPVYGYLQLTELLHLLVC